MSEMLDHSDELWKSTLALVEVGSSYLDTDFCELMRDEVARGETQTLAARHTLVPDEDTPTQVEREVQGELDKGEFVSVNQRLGFFSIDRYPLATLKTILRVTKPFRVILPVRERFYNQVRHRCLEAGLDPDMELTGLL